MSRPGTLPLMPLTTCPDCAGIVSTVAWFCPHCGRPGAALGGRKLRPVRFWLWVSPIWLALTVLAMYALPNYAFVLALVSVGLFLWTLRRARIAGPPEPTVKR